MRGKAFLKWTSIDLSFKLSITYGGNVSYYKSVHHPIPSLPVGTGNTLATFKTNQWTLLSIEFPHIFCSCPNWKGKKEKFAKFLMPFFKAQVSFPSNFASILSAIKHNSSVLFLAQTLYTLVKEAKVFRFWSVRVKICQIPHVSF